LTIDGAVSALSWIIAYLLPFDGTVVGPDARQMLVWLPCVVVARVVLYWRYGIYRLVWRYISLPDVLIIARTSSLLTALLLLVRYGYASHLPAAPWLHVPVSVICLDYLLSLAGTLGVRACRRLLYEQHQRGKALPTARPRRMLLYGAGSAGVLAIKELKGRGDVEVIGFVDDDPQKAGKLIAETKVLGNGEMISALAVQNRIEEVVISIAAPGKEFLTRMLDRCSRIPVSVKIIPTLDEIILRRTSIGQIHDIRVDDLLGREHMAVTGNQQLLFESYSGKRILVTGAGGSIGSELVRQLLSLEPEALAVLDKDENSIYELEQEVLLRYGESTLCPLIADVRNLDRLTAAFDEFRPAIVFHAAAYKHVPLMEKNPCEAILNNVWGTENVLKAARHAGAHRLVYISSDKAVNPTSIMGATKRLGEIMVRAQAQAGRPRAACVRFGNVLGSRGSVIPLFQKQIAHGGPVTVTHEEIMRYFMTIPEAVHLVMCAGALGRQGETFVLDMGQPRKIMDMAREMLALAGLEPGRDIEIRITGLRQGEKLCEKLVADNESLSRTEVQKVSMIVPGAALNYPAGIISELIRSAHANDSRAVYRMLSSLDIGFVSDSVPELLSEAAGPDGEFSEVRVRG
jgi:FlaA1/EpsC-like NDP-sugar epimerase